MSAGLISEPLPLIRSTLGTAIGMTHILLPVMILPIWASMLRVDPDLPKAASTLGAGPFTSFRRVFLPLTMPGVIGGCLLVFVMGLGFYITPALLGGPKDMMISMAVVMEVRRLNWVLQCHRRRVVAGDIRDTRHRGPIRPCGLDARREERFWRQPHRLVLAGIGLLTVFHDRADASSSHGVIFRCSEFLPGFPPVVLVDHQ
jgi:hypothetical protein